VRGFLILNQQSSQTVLNQQSSQSLSWANNTESGLLDSFIGLFRDGLVHHDLSAVLLTKDVKKKLKRSESKEGAAGKKTAAAREGGCWGKSAGGWLLAGMG
jgi:hypothetical protein